jgi:hypothetical protein
MTLETAHAADDWTVPGLKGKYTVVVISDDLYEIWLHAGRKPIKSVGWAHSEKEVVESIRRYDMA